MTKGEGGYITDQEFKQFFKLNDILRSRFRLVALRDKVDYSGCLI